MQVLEAKIMMLEADLQEERKNVVNQRERIHSLEVQLQQLVVLFDKVKLRVALIYAREEVVFKSVGKARKGQ